MPLNLPREGGFDSKNHKNRSEGIESHTRCATTIQMWRVEDPSEKELKRVVCLMIQAMLEATI
jgi:hypothetical protein